MVGLQPLRGQCNQLTLPLLLVIAEKNWRVLEQLESRGVVFEALQILGAEPYPLDLDDAVALEAAIKHQVYPSDLIGSCDIPEWIQAGSGHRCGNRRPARWSKLFAN